MTSAPPELLAGCRARADHIGVPAVLAEVVTGIARARGWPPPAAFEAVDEPWPVPADLAGPDLLGQVYEHLQTPADRRRRGAFYTPVAIADGLVELALRGRDTAGGCTVVDPSVGGGAVLLAAARALHRAGRAPAEVVAHDLRGADIDPLAVQVSAASLELWLAGHGVGRVAPRVVVGDTLARPEAVWGTTLSAAGADVVVGNPPFQGQLRSTTARSRDAAGQLQRRFGSVGPYADSAWLFLLVALELVAPGGRVALIQPESLLAARDAAAVRARVDELATLRHLWWAGEAVFGAATRVCVPVLDRRPAEADAPRSSIGRAEPGGAATITRSVGASFSEVSPLVAASGRRATWGWLTAGLGGTPSVRLDRDAGRLGDWCTATAGFRDQYYGLVPAVREQDPTDDAGRVVRLVTSGLVDPLVDHWGRRPCSFARRRWVAPVVDLELLATAAPDVARWARERLRPKLVVASQTRVIEAAVDAAGTWYPSTPTVAVHPHDGRLWEVAAVLCAPPLSALVLTELAGSALGPDHLRLPARALVELPLPRDLDALGEGARLARAASETTDPVVRDGHLLALGEVMCEAYGVTTALVEWWAGRLPAAERR